MPDGNLVLARELDARQGTTGCCWQKAILHGAAAPQRRKSKGKNQKAKISDPDFGPGWGGISTVWPQSKQSSMTQSSMTQLLSGAGNWPPREIFAARKEMGL
jgi:hypothetical protein